MFSDARSGRDHPEAVAEVAPRNVPLARVDSLVPIAIEPLAEVGHRLVNGPAVAHDPCLRGRAARVPTGPCRATDRIRGVRHLKRHASRRQSVHVGRVHVLAAVRRHGAEALLVGVDEDDVRLRGRGLRAALGARLRGQGDRRGRQGAGADELSAAEGWLASGLHGHFTSAWSGPRCHIRMSACRHLLRGRKGEAPGMMNRTAWIEKPKRGAA